MKKLFFLIIVLLGSFEGFSQNDTATVEQYCQVVATPRLLSTKVTVEMDFGDLRNIWKDNRLKDTEGRLVKFNTVIDALNYMGKEGWQLVNAFPVYNTQNTQVYHYIFKKRFSKADTLDNF